VTPKFTYPVPRGGEAAWRPTFGKRLLLRSKSLTKIIRPEPSSSHIELSLSGKATPQRPDRDRPFVVFLCHNDRRLLPSFLKHYRAMGVSGFACVDDRSDDGSGDYLGLQEDVDVYRSNVRYRDAQRGRIWRERLMAAYGLDRWYLNVDSDEFFVYETLGREAVGSYTQRLENARISRVCAPMLDLYPVSELSEAVLAEDAMPWMVATHFDGDGYRASVFNTGISIYGGVRSRVFDAPGELVKYPLIRWDRRCSMGRTIHRPRPALDNFAPVIAALLHFKIFSDVREMASRAVQEGQHFEGAKLYRRMLDRLATGDEHLKYEGSLPFIGVEDLVARGFIVPLEARQAG
jgi:hypothetical protein